MSEATEATQVLEGIKSLTAEEPPVLNVQAIAASVTEKVIATLSATPAESESTEPLPDEEVEEDADSDLAAQEKILNELDEADSVVSEKTSATISAPAEATAPQQVRGILQLPPPVTLSSEAVAVLKAALRANLTHVVLRVLTILLQEGK